MLKDRRRRVMESLLARGIEGCLIEDQVYLRYLTGFTGSEATALLHGTDCQLLVDSRYLLQATAECDEAVTVIQPDSRKAGITSWCQTYKPKQLGFVDTAIRYARFAELAAQLDAVTLVGCSEQLQQVRVCKDSLEISALASVGQLASQAFIELIPRVGAGVSEVDLAIELEFLMRRHGASGRGFDFIVASGYRGALPHGVASKKLLEQNELVTFDFGAVLDGYHSDETVTLPIGKPSVRHRSIYMLVRDAQEAALAAVQPGISCVALDAVARDVIRQGGYGEYFGHGLGHGVGLEIHEAPTISPRGSGELLPGMVITIEPGIYIPGFGGVRIEDTVLVTDTGYQRLTTVPKESW